MNEIGYLAIRALTGIPGMASTYGVSGDKLFYEPLDADLPKENLRSTEKYLAHIPKLSESLRTGFGSAPHFLHDMHHSPNRLSREHITYRCTPGRRLGVGCWNLMGRRDGHRRRGGHRDGERYHCV